jgi:hypothetical protein
MDILVGVKINLKLYKLLWLCGVKQQSVSLYDRIKQKKPQKVMLILVMSNRKKFGSTHF